MAKIAVLFLLFALVAIGFAARIAREEPKTLEDLQKSVGDTINKVLNNLLSDENMAQLKAAAESFGEKGKLYLKEASDKVEQAVKQ